LSTTQFAWRIVQSALIAFTLITQVGIADTPTTTIASLGLTQFAPIIVVNTAATAMTRFCVADIPKIPVVNTSAATTVCSGFAQFTLVIVVDAAATAVAGFRLAGIAKIPVVNTAATTTVCSGLAQYTLVIVVDAGATGIGIPAKHQKQRNNDSHHTLP
jgi:hypothetical protein